MIEGNALQPFHLQGKELLQRFLLHLHGSRIAQLSKVKENMVPATKLCVGISSIHKINYKKKKKVWIA